MRLTQGFAGADADADVAESGESARSHDDILCVQGAGTGGHVARPGLVNLDLPVVVKKSSDLGGAHVVVWIKTVGLGLLCAWGGVVHDEQHPARRNRGDERALRTVVRGAQQRRILRGNEVEGGVGQRGLDEACVHPVHVDSTPFGLAGSPVKRHL